MTSTTGEAGLTRRNLFKSILMPALAIAVVAGVANTTISSAEARTPSYIQGFTAGKILGRKHGYTDGYKGAYMVSYADEIINGRSRSLSVTRDDYIRGYKRGYYIGYKVGYRAGTRDGYQDGTQDAQNWKDNLRDEMRKCMENGTCR